MAKDRPPSFQFYPADYLADTGSLTDRQCRRYMDGLCRSWSCGAYGIGLPEEWRSWMGYPDGRGWEEDRQELERLFFVTPTEPVYWVQKRMVMERVEQRTRHLQARSGGVARSRGAPRSGGRFTSYAGGQHQPATSTAPGPSSSSSKEKKESKISCPAGHAKEWLEAYDRDFYPDYPPRGRNARRMNRSQGRKVWGTIQPQTQEQFDRVYAAMQRDKAEWARSAPEFIPMIDVWLRRKAWED